MAFSLGSLVVNLTANTASFIEGMTKAGNQVQKTAKEMEDRFSGLGNIAEKVLAPFGEIGEVISRSLEAAGESIGGATKMLGGLAEGMGGVAALAAGAVVGIAAMGAGLVGIAAWASKGAAELQELSEKTGVSVEMLSSLGYAAKQSGVNTESLGMALERLGKSAFAAATAPAGAVNAYTRLGIAVRDASGEMKPTSELLDEVADKFSHMENGTAKTALAMQVFGRAGAEMIPLLNKGKDGIADLTSEANLFGVTISGSTAKQAKEFQDSIDRIEGALMGVANALLKELVPSMNAGMNFILDLLHDGDNGFTVFTTAIKYGVEVIIDAFKVLVTSNMAFTEGLDLLGTVAKSTMSAVGGLFGGVASAIEKLKSGEGIKSAAQALKDGWAIGTQNFVKGIEDEGHKMSDRLTKFYAGLWFNMDTGKQTQEPKKDFHPDMSPSDKGNHPDFVAAKIKLLGAEADAQARLATATDRTTAAENANAAANAANKVVTELQNKAESEKGAYRQKFLSEIQQQTDKIKALVAATLAFKEANTVSDDLQKQNEKLQDSTKAFEARTAALLSGGKAIDEALEAEKLAPYVRAVSEATQRLAELSSMQGATAQEVNAAKQAIAEANTELDTHRQLLQKNRDAEIDFQIATELSYENETAKKIAALEAFGAAHALTANQQLTLETKIYDLQRQQLEEYDQMLLKTDSARNGVQAFFNDLSLNSKNTARDVHDSLSQAFTQLSDQLTNFVTTGKMNLASLAQSIEKDFISKAVKNSLSVGLGKLGGMFGVKTDITKPDGSTEQNALWVQIAKPDGTIGGTNNPLGAILGMPSAKPKGPSDSGDQSGALGITNPLSQIGSKISDAFGGIFGKLGGMFGSLMQGAGGIFGSLGSIFGGFMADGGNVWPGKSYIVGEKRAEVFKPRGAGEIVPNMSSGKGSKPIIFSPQYNINTPNPDSFRKSQSQIIAEGYAQAALAHSRNG